MKKCIAWAVACCVCLSSAIAQADLQPGAAVKAAMEKVKFLEGSWAGSGWLQMGPQRHEFKQTEFVQFHANGTVLTIDGRGVDTADSSRIVHQAFAMLSYDQQAGKYLMRAIRADGNHVDADFVVNADGSITWGFSHPIAGKIRYNIRYENGRWLESGAISRDGESWMTVIKMTRERE